MFARTATKLLLALALCGALSALAQTKINANQINGIATVTGTPAVGDLLYGTSATTFGLLPDVATGSYLKSGGVTTAPSWAALFPLQGPTLDCTTPTYGFSASTNTGIQYAGGGNTNIGFCSNGAIVAKIGQAGFIAYPGTINNAGFTDITNGTSGFSFLAPNTVSVVDSTDLEWARFITRGLQFSSAKADAVGYAINARKSRGTVSVPTVITTADALLTQSGYGYVGGTNTYREATRIEFDSTGTIADATTGIGGIIKLMTTKAGTDSTVQTALTISGGSTSDVKFAGTLSATSVMISSTAPTLGSGGCTTPSSVTALNGTALFKLASVGSSCSGSQPLVFTLPAATTGWLCTSRNVTNGATSAPAQTGAVSTTSVTITNFVRTTGVAGAWTNADEVWVSCVGG